jgi:hypothetical protein
MSENKNKNDNIQARLKKNRAGRASNEGKKNEALTNEDEKDVEIGRFQLYNSM